RRRPGLSRAAQRRAAAAGRLPRRQDPGRGRHAARHAARPRGAVARLSRAMARRLLGEPLVHFLALGAALFALYGALDRDGFDAPDEIVVDRARLASLAAEFERRWRRPPTPEERRELVESWVREEILVREGVALGMDRDDPVV